MPPRCTYSFHFLRTCLLCAATVDWLPVSQTIYHRYGDWTPIHYVQVFSKLTCTFSTVVSIAQSWKKYGEEVLCRVERLWYQKSFLNPSRSAWEGNLTQVDKPVPYSYFAPDSTFTGTQPVKETCMPLKAWHGYGFYAFNVYKRNTTSVLKINARF